MLSPSDAAGSPRTEVIHDIAGHATEVSHRFVATHGIRLHYVRATPCVGAKTLVFLHGYPEFWYAWKNQLVHFANLGFDVIAPDLRGFNESDKPIGKGAYAMKNVANDIIGLIEELVPARRVVLVSHDWGGSAAWQLAYDRPDLVEHLVELNTPQPNQIRAVKRHPFKYPKEFCASLYIVAMALPWIPEFVFQKVLGFSRAFDIFVRGNFVHKNNLSADDEARILASWKVPGALIAGTDYYRDNLSYFDAIPDRPLGLPVTLLFGMKDMFMSARFPTEFKTYQPDATVIEVQDSGHYILQDTPDAVNTAIDAIVGKPPRG